VIFASRNLTVRLEDTLAGCPYFQRIDGGKCDRRASCSWAGEPLCITDEPHGGWETEVYSQHHEPNPILVAFRAHRLSAAGEWHAAVFATEIYGGMRAWDAPDHPFHVLTTASDEQLDHAERILNRLALAQEAAL
jgi:hypothetical protein